MQDGIFTEWHVRLRIEYEGAVYHVIVRGNERRAVFLEVNGVSAELVHCRAPRMARPLRIEYEGAVYDVIGRGNERRAVFLDHSDRKRYLLRLAHYRERFGFRLYAFCLMSNHVHLAIESGKEPLSRITRVRRARIVTSCNDDGRRSQLVITCRYTTLEVAHTDPGRARVRLQEGATDRGLQVAR